jgi:hypothetical protein
LGGTGQHRNRLRQLAVGGEPAVGVGVGAQDVRQGHRVDVVGFLARDAVAFPVARHGHGVDGIDRAAGGAQRGDQQSPGGFDRDRDRFLGAITRFGQQGE